MIKKLKNFFLNKTGSFEQLGGAAMSVVVFTITLALGALVLGTVRSNPNILLVRNSTGAIVEGTAQGNANATLAVEQGLSGLSDLSSWTGILVIVIVFAVILGLIYGFYRKSM